MSRNAGRYGFTLIEVLMSFAVLGFVILFVYKFGAPIFTFFQHSQARQTATNEARSCLNTIGTAMRAGLANSVNRSTANGVTAPNSRIDFALPAPLASGTTAYAFFLTPSRTVQMQEFKTSGSITKTLASNVTGLMFTGDYRDTSVFYVTLRIDAPFDSQGKTFTTIDLEDQEVHMVVNH